MGTKNNNKPLHSQLLFTVLTEVHLRQIIKEEISSLVSVPTPTNSEQKNKNDYLTIDQVMEYLSCSRSSIRNYIKQGKLKPRFFGDRKYFKLKEIEKEMVQV